MVTSRLTSKVDLRSFEAVQGPLLSYDFCPKLAINPLKLDI